MQMMIVKMQIEVAGMEGRFAGSAGFRQGSELYLLYIRVSVGDVRQCQT